APRGAVRLHWPSFTGSWALGREASIAAADGYDDAVILHEIGHLVHNLYSDSDSPGGIHYFGDSDQDPRLSFAEGFATFFSGCVQQSLGRPALYVDCDGALDVGGVELRLRVEDCAPYAGSVEGASDEIAVACVLHDLVDGAASPDGLPGVDDDALPDVAPLDGASQARAWWAVFTGPVRKANRLTMDHVWDGWLAVHAADPHYAEVRSVFEQQRMRFWNDAAEPDDAPDLATLLAPLPAGVWEPERTLYSSASDTQGPGTGDRDWFAVDLVAGQAVRIETRYPAGAWDARTQADTFLSVRTPAGKLAATDDDSGTGRNARIDLPLITQAGRWTFEVSSRNAVHRYGRYEVHVVLLSAP
ncbi:MAG TPA: PPC domain-containing protein, partial [Planctomycetota bacterium]|nr:PPC domain-containing protein [Planctomycetota bacterium]